MITTRHLALAWVYCTLGCAAAARTNSHDGHDWPQWRGPHRSNASLDTGLLRAWPSQGPPLRWITTGLGEGITSVAVVAGSLYTLGYRQDAEYLHALDAIHGASLWSTPVGDETDRRLSGVNALMRWLSPRVPTVDQDRIYTVSAGGLLTCVGTQHGEVRWQLSYPRQFQSPPRTWGFCDYPLVDGESLIGIPAAPKAFIVALNKRTGDVLWKSAEPSDDGAGYGAMVVTEATGRRHYVALLQKSLVGIAPEDGRILWRHPRPVLRIASSYTPLVSGNWIVSPNGYAGGLVGFRILRDSEDLGVAELYSEKINFNPFQDATVLVGEHLYCIANPGQETCIHVPTGQRVWTSHADNQNRRAALTYADGHLIVRRSDGSVTLVEAVPDSYREKGRFKIPHPEEVSGVTSPVVARQRLYLRDNDRLLCYDLRDHGSPHTQTVVQNIPLRSAVDLQASVPQAEANATGIGRPPDAIFVPTPHDIVEPMLAMASLNAGQVLYDLGSGDGRFLIAAAKLYGCTAVGLEIDGRLVTESRELVRSEGLEHLVTIEHTDLFDFDFSGADVVTAYLPSPLLERLLPKFRALKRGSRIVTHQFPIPGLPPAHERHLISKEDGDRHTIRLWLTP
ncbi:MAG: PQQ-binding-like beta-propeller repeat protein [Verrucomicrobiales bacterium]|nr:PQQ-binding-like beta-propeller repeat protein [Verrucomicrobiales bacterium]